LNPGFLEISSFVTCSVDEYEALLNVADVVRTDPEKDESARRNPQPPQSICIHL
jgi:hypothetical protein